MWSLLSPPQIAEYEADKKEELEASKTLQQLRSDIRSELKEKMDDLETTRMEVLEEISELADEKGKLEAALIAKTVNMIRETSFVFWF